MTLEKQRIPQQHPYGFIAQADDDEYVSESLDAGSAPIGDQALYSASQWQLMWWRFRKHRLAVISSILLLFF